MAKTEKPKKRGGHDHPYFVERRKKDEILKELAFRRGLQEIKGNLMRNMSEETVSLPKITEAKHNRKGK